MMIPELFSNAVKFAVAGNFDGDAHGMGIAEIALH